MIINRETILKWVNQQLSKVLGDKNTSAKLTRTLNETRSIPLQYASDLITMRKSVDNEPDEVLYTLVELLDPSKITDFFTETEITAYKQYKYKQKKIKFPLHIKAIQVSGDQWIGKVTVKELMRLRDAQLIYYNENTQRRLRHVTHGNVEYYTIDLKQTAVESIKQLLTNHTYIPDPITLNIPGQVFVEYHESECDLVIHDLDHFDILDGYHRYIAISSVYNLDHSFDYDMELRIVTFSEGKAQQFIWQQDQKTKMQKVDSDAMNQSNFGSRVIERINYENSFYLHGKIARNGGLIDYGSMAKLINELFLPYKESNKRTAQLVFDVSDLLKDGMNRLVDENHGLLDKKWNHKFLLSVLYCIKKNTVSMAMVDKVYQVLRQPQFQYIRKSYKIGSRDLTRIEKGVEELV